MNALVLLKLVEVEPSVFSAIKGLLDEITAVLLEAETLKEVRVFAQHLETASYALSFRIANKDKKGV
jgi:hypothetical protein